MIVVLVFALIGLASAVLSIIGYVNQWAVIFIEPVGPVNVQLILLIIAVSFGGAAMKVGNTFRS